MITLPKETRATTTVTPLIIIIMVTTPVMKLLKRTEVVTITLHMITNTLL